MVSANPRTELEQQMIGRVRRHMLTALGGVFAGMALAGLGAAGMQLFMVDGKIPPFAAVLPLLGFVAMPAIGFYSTFKNLRCPACEKPVVWQVSWNYSLFSSAAGKNCQSCGKKIFADDTARRVGRVLVVVMAVAAALGFLGAMASAATRKEQAQQQQQQPAPARKLLASCVGLTSEADCAGRCAADEACLAGCTEELKACDALRAQVR